MRVLVTGGAGFIGSHFAKRLLAAGDDVRVLDKLTYSGNPANLEGSGIELLVGDICDADAVAEAAAGCDAIVNFAAETHVDRSILGPAEFIQTNVAGTQVLLDHARDAGIRLVHVSTDEVYGDVPEGVSSAEDDPLRPSSPYSAAKAGGDLQVLGSVRTYGVDALITRGSNTYGPNQYPEKLLPLFVTNALDGEPLPHVRRRQPDPGLALRRGSRCRDRARAPPRPRRRGLQRRRRRGGDEPRDHGPRARAHRRRRVARAPGRGPAGPRPPLLARHDEGARGARLGAADAARARASRSRRPGTRENRAWWEPIKSSGGYREYYEKQYAARLASSS